MTTDLTLEQAQHTYGRSLVPWVLDEDDLKIINRTRRDCKAQTGSCMRFDEGDYRRKDINEILHKRLWYEAQKSKEA